MGETRRDWPKVTIAIPSLLSLRHSWTATVALLCHSFADRQTTFVRSLVQSSHFGTQLLRALHVVTVIKQDVRVINQKIRAKLTFCTDKLYAQSAVPPYLKAFRLSPRRLPSQPALLRRAFTSEATASLSPQPSESHIVRYGACRHSTAADSLIVLYRFSSHQRFMCL